MATADAGQKLLDCGHYASDDVKEKLVVLAEEKTSLLSLWEERRILYEQCMDLQLFYRRNEHLFSFTSYIRGALRQNILTDVVG